MIRRVAVSVGLIFSIFLLLLASCSSSVDDATESLPEYEIAFVDSFGVEVGNSDEMLGYVVDFCHDADGSVLLLDQVACEVRVVGCHDSVSSISRAGSGPGEMLYPLSLCVFSSGRMLVADEMKHAVMEFDDTGEYCRDIFVTEWYAPYSMYPADSGAIVCSIVSLDYTPEIPEYVYSIEKYNAAGELLNVYSRMSWEWTSSEFYRDIGIFDFTACSDGTVYIVADNTRYNIQVCDSEGSELFSINRYDVIREEKTETQIQFEIEEFEEWAAQDQAYMGGYEPSHFFSLIELCGIDAQGNLWVRRLRENPDCVFDVYDQAGMLIHQSRLRRSETDWGLIFSVDPYGILAITDDDADFQRVYMLDVVAEQ